ncbi:unnamed protein product [Dovyalis caffra]|uniref:Uncharacterized protein n=1 Tax=Dovyalis caffra TaxID=77055 RepID=A0AAV1STB6_9ROSI|nr:unnamed protein product [Dovyalis caffra]
MTVVFVNDPEEKIKAEPFMLNLVGSKETMAFKRIPDAEAQARRDKGLCYRCDEKWYVGHRCKNRELYVILVRDEFDEEGLVIEAREEEVLVEKLGLPISITPNYGMVIGNGSRLKREGIYEGVLLELLHLTVSEENVPDIGDITISKISASRTRRVVQGRGNDKARIGGSITKEEESSKGNNKLKHRATKFSRWALKYEKGEYCARWLVNSSSSRICRRGISERVRGLIGEHSSRGRPLGRGVWQSLEYR